VAETTDGHLADQEALLTQKGKEKQMRIEDREVQKTLGHLRTLMDTRDELRAQIPGAAPTMEEFIVQYLDHGYLPDIGDDGVVADMALLCGTVNGICLLLDISTSDLLATVRGSAL
jgi:hypothetical protein